MVKKSSDRLPRLSRIRDISRVPHIAKLYSTIAAEYIAKLKALGVKVTTPDLASFRTAMGPAYDKIRKYAGKDNVDTFLAMCDKLR